jgi:hypothetical protein
MRCAECGSDSIKIGEMTDCARSDHPGPGRKGENIIGHMTVAVPAAVPGDQAHCVLQWVWVATHRSVTRPEYYDGSMQRCEVCSGLDRFLAHRDEGELVARTRRVGEIVVRLPTFTDRRSQPASRHGGTGRHFEVIAGKVIDGEGTQHRFAFVRNAPMAASDVFKQVLAAGGCGHAGVGAVRRRCWAVAAAT